MQIDLPPEIRQASRADWRQLAAITADGFAEDPVMGWVLGPPRAILSGLRVFARDIYLPHGMCHLSGDAGATMWMPHGAAGRTGPLTMVQFALGQMRHGRPGALKRAETATAAMARHHPKAPHLYLFTIAARKAARGRGIGKGLLAPVLAACDRDGMPVYLENSNPVNNGFYLAHGFEPLDAFAVGEADGAPSMVPMWREPRSVSGPLPGGAGIR